MAVDDSDPRRDALHAFLQEQGPVTGQAAVLTGWVVIFEWMGEDGNRWLAKGHSASLTGWAANGFHHEALYAEWGEDNDEDDSA